MSAVPSYWQHERDYAADRIAKIDAEIVTMLAEVEDARRVRSDQVHRLSVCDAMLDDYARMDEVSA